MSWSYIHPSRVEMHETAGYRPTRDELREEETAAARRRLRAAQARATIAERDRRA